MISYVLAYTLVHGKKKPGYPYSRRTGMAWTPDYDIKKN